MRSPHLVCYDIASDRTRRRAFKTLRARGEALQRSVFLVRTCPKGAERLERDLRALAGPGDAVLVVRVVEGAALPRPEPLIV
ncbi:CRISPR-associated endonuclease Cas2 [Aliiruegeria sabulilitoris]|uniref:CRISPR-associated endonuclease Cas2 n=1 Tax=Aliiruegeria sabulilitoris TaxID=1510458 RepID=UPI00083623B5